MADKLKRVAAVLIVTVGIGGFYYFGDKPGYVQAAILLVAGIAAIVMFYQTAAGKATWEFAKGARTELRKVVWPNQKETVQVTIIVFVMAVVVAVFLWIVDWGLHKIIKTVTG
jgi:preprotein translocase subunit SecE